MLYQKVCEYCGEPFETREYRRRYHPECARKYKRERAKELRREDRRRNKQEFTCSLCGKKYTISMLGKNLDDYKRACPSCRPKLAHESKKKKEEELFRELKETQEWYDKWPVLEGDWIVSADFHGHRLFLPMLKRLITIAKKFGIRNLLINGDLFDVNTLQHYDIYVKDSNVHKEMVAVRKVIEIIFMHFDRVIWTMGNHDLRLLRVMQFEVTPEDLGRRICDKMDSGELQASLYPYAVIKGKFGDYRITHPNSYGNRTGTVPRALCHKYHKHCIVTHGHHGGMEWDDSGDYMAIDLGAMTHHQLHPYIMFSDTTHKRWNRDFGMVYRGSWYRFTDHPAATDWDFWLKAVDPRKLEGRERKEEMPI